jgi:hypothetical protein
VKGVTPVVPAAVVVLVVAAAVAVVDSVPPSPLMMYPPTPAEVVVPVLDALRVFVCGPWEESLDDDGAGTQSGPAISTLSTFVPAVKACAVRKCDVLFLGDEDVGSVLRLCEENRPVVFGIKRVALRSTGVLNYSTSRIRRRSQ